MSSSTINSSDAQTIAELQATITRLEQENRKLKRLVAIDPLTQVANRKTFEQRLREEWKRARRNRSVLSLLMLDIDQLREANSKREQNHINSMLQRLAFALSRVPRRSTDTFARYDTGQFAVILPDTPEEGAKRLAEILLQQAHFCDVTISVGVSTLSPSESDFRQLLDSANQYLRQARQQGGNCVVGS